MNFLYDKLLKLINYEADQIIRNVCDIHNIGYTYLLIGLALKIKLWREKK